MPDTLANKHNKSVGNPLSHFVEKPFNAAKFMQSPRDRSDREEPRGPRGFKSQPRYCPMGRAPE